MVDRTHSPGVSLGQTASANGEGFGSITALRAAADEDEGLLLRALLMEVLLPAAPAGLPKGWHLRRLVGR